MTHPRAMNADDLHHLTVVDETGAKIGKVSGVYLDTENRNPEWAAVKTGALGGHETLVPLVAASTTGSELRVPYAKDMVKRAPHHDPDTELSEATEAELFTYYQIPWGGDTVTATGTGQQQATPPAAPVAPVAAPAAPAPVRQKDTDGSLTRSEERLRVGTERFEAGRARLVKHIVTEDVSVTVPVTSERARIVSEPITDADRAGLTGVSLAEQEMEVALHREQVVVAKETVPVERVRLDTQVVTEQQQVTDTVRKEVIDTETIPADAASTDTAAAETTMTRTSPDKDKR